MRTTAYTCPSLVSVSETNSLTNINLGRQGFASSYSLQFHDEEKSGGSWGRDRVGTLFSGLFSGSDSATFPGPTTWPRAGLHCLQWAGPSHINH